MILKVWYPALVSTRLVNEESMVSMTLILLARIQAFLISLSPDFVMHILAIISSFIWSKDLICITSISSSKLLLKMLNRIELSGKPLHNSLKVEINTQSLTNYKSL